MDLRKGKKDLVKNCDVSWFNDNFRINSDLCNEEDLN